MVVVDNLRATICFGINFSTLFKLALNTRHKCYKFMIIVQCNSYSFQLLSVLKICRCSLLINVQQQQQSREWYFFFLMSPVELIIKRIKTEIYCDLSVWKMKMWNWKDKFVAIMNFLYFYFLLALTLISLGSRILWVAIWVFL